MNIRNLSDTIKKAEKREVALGHFNIAGFEQLQAIVNVARRLDLPVLIGVSEGERKYLGVRRVRDLADSCNKEYGNPEAEWGFWLFVNADHTRDAELAADAAKNGFDEVLFDGGKLALDEDIKQTKAVVQNLKTINPNVLVEGEMGYIGSSSEVWGKIPEGVAISEEMLTKPEDAARFVSETGVDILAPAVGNIHGMFRDAPNPRLNIERIKEIKKATGVPLVLHGGSGIEDEDFILAIDAGVNIIHISTEMRRAWRESLDVALKEKPDEIAPYHIMSPVVEAVARVVESRLRLFNGLGK